MAVEIKTNLDKTMFQEASATASDLKLVLPSSKFFVLCEWLDMPVVSTASTPIDEAIVLRRARRMGSHARGKFSTAAGRAAARGMFQQHLTEHPLSVQAFRRFLFHIERLLDCDLASEEEVLDRSWF